MNGIFCSSSKATNNGNIGYIFKHRSYGNTQSVTAQGNGNFPIYALTGSYVYAGVGGSLNLNGATVGGVAATSDSALGTGFVCIGTPFISDPALGANICIE